MLKIIGLLFGLFGTEPLSYTVTASDFVAYAGQHDVLIQQKIESGKVSIYMPAFESAYQFKNPVLPRSGTRIYLGAGAHVYAMPYNFTNIHFIGLFKITGGVQDVKILGNKDTKAVFEYYDFYAYQYGGTNRFAAGSPNKSGIYIMDAMDVEVADIRFVQCPGDGVTVDENTGIGERTRNVLVRDIETYRCARSGVVITARDTITLQDSILEESGVANQPGQFRYDQGEGVHIEAYRPPLYGILVSNVTTIGCSRGLKVSMANTNNETTFNTWSDIRIKNCTFADSRDYGLMFRNCYDGVAPGFIEARYCVITNSGLGGIRFQNWGPQVQVKLVQQSVYNSAEAIRAPVSIAYYGGDPALAYNTLESIGNIWVHSVHVLENSHDYALTCNGNASAGVLVSNVWGGMWVHGTTNAVQMIDATNVNVTITN